MKCSPIPAITGSFGATKGLWAYVALWVLKSRIWLKLPRILQGREMEISKFCSISLHLVMSQRKTYWTDFWNFQFPWRENSWKFH